MSRPDTVRWSPEVEASPFRGSLGWALLVSLLLHLLVAAAWESARNLVQSHPDWFPAAIVAAVLPKPAEAAAQVPTAVEMPPEVEIPLEFVEVDPRAATAEEPDAARFYSTANTLAANPNPPKPDEKVPYVDGWDAESHRTFRVETPSVETVVAASSPRELDAVREPAPPERSVLEAIPERPSPEPAEPARSVDPTPPVERVEARPPGGEMPGETRIARVEPRAVVPAPQTEQVGRDAVEAVPVRPRPTASAPPSRRSRSVREAREAQGLLVGEKMQQEGGVGRFRLESSLDVKASPFADYDRQFIFAVQQRWYQLLEEHRYSLDRSGKVVLRFRLQSDGSVADMTQVQSDVGEIWAFLCESAVLTPSPYARWPSEMRRLIGAESREVTFTFRYY